VIAARRLAIPALAAILALVVLLALRPVSSSRALAIWIVIVTALALVVLVRHSRSGPEQRSHFEAAVRGGTAKAADPVDLLRMERELELGIASAGNAHLRLLPLLRSAAAARLTTRHGIELERRPDAARELLGDDVWELLRPDRPEPADRFDPGVPRDQVTAAIERVESL
jgi:hypothetical protein